jgi:hypothetical protein
MFNRRFREVMSSRTIEDLSLKMAANRRISEPDLIQLFFEMCDLGIDVYIQEEKKRFPGKSDIEIMKDFHLQKIAREGRM